MINGQERLIVVLGMAHSGTTILTYLLQQHPQVKLARNGGEAWILENTWLPLEQPSAIAEFLAQHPHKRILLKRPLAEYFHSSFLLQSLPSAKFLYCYRPFEEIAYSWSKETSFVDNRLRYGTLEFKKQCYDDYTQKAETFAKQIPYFRKVFHPALVEKPQLCLAELTQWLGLDHFVFNISHVSRQVNIKDLLVNRLVRVRE